MSKETVYITLYIIQSPYNAQDMFIIFVITVDARMRSIS